MMKKSIGFCSKKKHTNRALRGLTSAGTKGRGLTSKGKGSEQARRKKNKSPFLIPF